MKGTYSQSSLWDRREFLKGAALSAGAGVAAGCASAFRSGAHIAGPRRVDLQVNGRVGVSFTDRELTAEGVLKVVEALRDGGTGALVSASDVARKLWSRDYAPGWEMT